jgi:drug/metabolite transporter (DMT)-like permease
MVYLSFNTAFKKPDKSIPDSLFQDLACLRLTKAGRASMLMALPPVIVLPISYFVFKEKVGWQAVLGTVPAIAGVAVLFLA